MKSIVIQLCALIATLLAITIGSVTADATFTPILPPSYPLAVRNPYLSGELSNPSITSSTPALGFNSVPV
jgi:uncharacterized membrane protein